MADSVDLLVRDLSSRDGLVRQRARESLVVIGRPAVPPLIEALRARGRWTRWEAAKALAEIGDPRAAAALVAALEDRGPGVRWLAAVGLITLREKGVPPLLRALMRRSSSVWLREGAHHVLRALTKGDLDGQLIPVVDALEGVQPAIETPHAALAALEVMEMKPVSEWQQ